MSDETTARFGGRMNSQRMTADEMKLARDGQLSYGLPDRHRQRLAACAARGHADILEYTNGRLRCLSCLQFINPPTPRSETP